MTLKNKEQFEGLENFKAKFNLIVISGLFLATFVPSYIFYITGAGEFKWLALFIGISYLISRIPNSFYFRFQISRDLRVYKKLGVNKFKRFSSNGDLINRRIRKKYPTYRNVRNLESVNEKINETYTIERGHTVLFVFFLLTNIYVFWTNSIVTGVVLLIGNVVFNFYPNLLQQYNRIRYEKVIENYDLTRN